MIDFNDEQKMIQKAVRKIAREKIADLAVKADVNGRSSQEIIKVLCLGCCDESDNRCSSNNGWIWGYEGLCRGTDDAGCQNDPNFRRQQSNSTGNRCQGTAALIDLRV